MSTQYKPVTAITMGDPAGIGPEIVVGTMLSEEIHDCCRPFVIGSIAIMDRAAKVLGKELKYNKIEDPSEAKYEFGTVDIIETGDYDTDSIEWGKVQALAGQMAVDWIMKSIELGEAGKIDAVSTAPIHKGAIKLIGVKEPGHTEIYQNVTHSPYALTMFSCHKLRVFFVSRHMSLVDACHYATKDVILEDVINIDKELRKVGIENPLIAVAGLNPHNGDNGLFGREEIDEIEPAVKAAQEKGINAIVVASKAISKMHIGRIDYETTSNIGHIEGGSATNIVTDEVTFTAEIRSHSMEKLAAEVTHMEQCCKEAVEEMGACYEMKHEMAYPVLSLEEDCELIQDTVNAMAEERITANKMIIGGGSDANVLAGHGYKSVILGCGMINVHTVEEALDTEETWKVTKVLRRLMGAE